MKFYFLHVVIKDFLLFFLFMIISGSLGLGSLFITILFSLKMISGIIIIDLILQTILFFGLKHYLKFRNKYKQFLFGLGLHIPTAFFWIQSMRIESDQLSKWTSLILSGLISGVLYVILNRRPLKNKHTTLNTQRV